MRRPLPGSGIVSHVMRNASIPLITIATLDLFDAPAHPYTQALISAIPVPDPVVQRGRQHRVIEGELPSPAKPPKGCAFHTRCPLAQSICRSQRPTLLERTPGHWSACHIEVKRP